MSVGCVSHVNQEQVQFFSGIVEHFKGEPDESVLKARIGVHQITVSSVRPACKALIENIFRMECRNRLPNLHDARIQLNRSLETGGLFKEQQVAVQLMAKCLYDHRVALGSEVVREQLKLFNIEMFQKDGEEKVYIPEIITEPLQLGFLRNVVNELVQIQQHPQQEKMSVVINNLSQPIENLALRIARKSPLLSLEQVTIKLENLGYKVTSV